MPLIIYLYNLTFEEGERFPKNLIYLTIICAFFVAISAVGLVVLHIRSGWGTHVDAFFGSLSGLSLCLTRAIYIIYELGVTLQLLVPAMYWIALYPSLDEKPVGYDLFLEINVHGLFAVFISADYLMCQIDVIKSHIYIQQAFTIGYIIFNYWYSVNYEIIYSIISWDNTFTYVFVVLAFIVATCGFYICAFIGGLMVMLVLR